MTHGHWSPRVSRWSAVSPCRAAGLGSRVNLSLNRRVNRRVNSRINLRVNRHVNLPLDPPDRIGGDRRFQLALDRCSNLLKRNRLPLGPATL
jgi:hypothetical protein